jgi:hypothetical protein
MYCINITTRNNAFGFHTAQLVSSVTKTRLNFATYTEAVDYAEAFAKWSGHTFIGVMDEPKDNGKTYVQVDYKG